MKSGKNVCDAVFAKCSMQFVTEKKKIRSTTLSSYIYNV